MPLREWLLLTAELDVPDLDPIFRKKALREIDCAVRAFSTDTENLERPAHSSLDPYYADES